MKFNSYNTIELQKSEIELAIIDYIKKNIAFF